MHKYDPKKHDRKAIRLKGYDYATPGLYFITICVQNRACLFGEVQNGRMVLNAAGQMVEKEWLKLPDRFPNILIHEFVVMPNHFHGILEIVDITVGATLPVGATGQVGATLVVAPTCPPDGDGQPRGLPLRAKPKTVGDIIGAFQSIVTVEYIRGVKLYGWPAFDQRLWQRNYWEHIIRSEVSFFRISNYIKNNPAKWDEDKFY